MLNYIYRFLYFLSKWMNTSILQQIRHFGYRLSKLGIEDEEAKFYAALDVGNLEEAKQWMGLLLEKGGISNPNVSQAAEYLSAEILYQEEQKEVVKTGPVREFLYSKVTHIDIRDNPDDEPTEIVIPDYY